MHNNKKNQTTKFIILNKNSIDMHSYNMQKIKMVKLQKMI
jgi:hypothetical protein